MAPATMPGEPRKAPKPEPSGNIPLISLFTTCTLCIVFLLWRRASALRTVVAHKLNTWTQKQGTIRLSEDDGPPAIEFLSDEFDQYHQNIGDEEPLAVAAEQLQAAHADITPEDVGRTELPDGLPLVPPPKV